MSGPRGEATDGDPESVLGRNFAQPYEPQASVEAAWRAVYQDLARHWELYKLAEDLVDVAY